MGSARRVWLWFCSQGLRFPLHSNTLQDIRWVTPTYTKIHQVLTNPFYAGVYVYGRTQQVSYIDESGRVRKRIKARPRAEWPVFIRDHHRGFIDWETFEANQKRLAQNTRPRPHQSGGAVREGTALLQGIAACGGCGRRLKVHYTRPLLRARVSLRRQDHRQRPRRVLSQRRRLPDRCGGRRSVPRGTRARRPRGLAEGRRTARSGSRDHRGAVPARCRACALRRATRRTPLSGRRSRQSTGRPRARSRVGEHPA